MLILIFSFILVDSALMLLAPFLIGKAVDAMNLHKGIVDFSFLEIMIVILVTAYVADAALTFLAGWLMAGVAQRIVKSIRESLFKKLQKLPVSFFDQRTHGELMSRLSNDVDNVSNTVLTIDDSINVRCRCHYAGHLS